MQEFFSAGYLSVSAAASVMSAAAGTVGGAASAAVMAAAAAAATACGYLVTGCVGSDERVGLAGEINRGFVEITACRLFLDSERGFYDCVNYKYDSCRHKQKTDKLSAEKVENHLVDKILGVVILV